MELTQRLAFFSAMVSEGRGLYLWEYDTRMQLLQSTAPESDQAIFDELLTQCSCKEDILAAGREASAPLVGSLPFGPLWAAVFERGAGELRRVYLLGPILNIDLSLNTLQNALRPFRVSLNWRQSLLQYLQQLPVIPANQLHQYCLMLHFCVTDEHLTIADLRHRVSPAEAAKKRRDSRLEKKDRHQTYMAEQALLRMVREGDINYKSALSRASMISNGVHVKVGDAVLHTQITYVTFITLCVRAAIEGGLSPEIAYELGDSYIQQIMDCPLITEMTHIGHRMYEDFIVQVHKSRLNPAVSREVRSTCDFIELSAQEKLSIQALAERVGYTDYYLSRKFKREMGCSINDYIKIARIEQAKLLLCSTRESIQEISDRLNFCSRSHFADTFKSLVGATPVEYRQQTQRL